MSSSRKEYCDSLEFRETGKYFYQIEICDSGESETLPELFENARDCTTFLMKYIEHCGSYKQLLSNYDELIESIWCSTTKEDTFKGYRNGKVHTVFRIVEVPLIASK